MMSDTMRAEASGPTSNDVLYEFTGQLTTIEVWRWYVWAEWNSAVRAYSKWAVGIFVLILVCFVLQYRTPGQSGMIIGVPLILFHIYFFSYFLFRLIVRTRIALKHKLVDGRDNTVRFYGAKVEVVSYEGNVNQFSAKFVRIRRTGFGIAVGTPNGLPLFLLPSRVLTSHEMKTLPELYTTSS